MSTLIEYLQQKANTLARNKAIHQRYLEIYEIGRIRYDDCISQLSGEFYLSNKYIERIIYFETRKQIAEEEAKEKEKQHQLFNPHNTDC